MCGIAGFVSRSPLDAGSSLPTLSEMLQRLAHRGPDGHGAWHDAHAFLGHRRLAIVDLAGGHQPMPNEDENLWLTYNGEVFNHAELRPALEAAGHRYRNRSDSETLLHAFEEFGPQSVERYRGMFAYALWNRQRRELFAVRDRLGIKPFYYYWDGVTFVFASEIKALLAHPSVPARPALSTFAEYLSFGYLDGSHTMFEGIHALPPGHWLRLQLSGDTAQLHIEPYWDAPAPTHDVPRQPEEIASELAHVVQLRLMSDVPLGLFLSGGVDSSTIAALVKRHAAGPVKTFSVGYSEERYSELAYARQTAAALGTEHHEVSVSATGFFGALPQLVYHEDEPITWPSSVPLYFVSQLARQHVAVVLTGEGADELFAGYQRYRHYQRDRRLAAAYSYFPSPLRSLLRQSITHLPGLAPNLRRKLGHTILGRELSLESLYLDNYYGAFSRAEIAALLPQDAANPYATFLSYFTKHPEASVLRRLLYADQKTYLAELLRKQDRMSMAASIESRVPFLDHHFLALAAALPDSTKLAPNGENKFILKQAVRGIIPQDIIDRPKMGFPTPIQQWLNGPYRSAVHSLLTAQDSFLSQTLSPAAVQATLAQHGRQDATDRVWRLLTLELWGRRFFLQRPTEILP
jgi:asparagine synthase (glutamine-hydrolysing)